MLLRQLIVNCFFTDWTYLIVTPIKHPNITLGLKINILKHNDKSNVLLKKLCSLFRFSQEKFVRKKSKKYFPYVMIRRPSIRLLAEIYYANDPMKIMNMRIDSLAQMLNNANVRAGANYMVRNQTLSL
jgi:hypothetical protein